MPHNVFGCDACTCAGHTLCQRCCLCCADCCWRPRGAVPAAAAGGLNSNKPDRNCCMRAWAAAGPKNTCACHSRATTMTYNLRLGKPASVFTTASVLPRALQHAKQAAYVPMWYWAADSGWQCPVSCCYCAPSVPSQSCRKETACVEAAKVAADVTAKHGSSEP